MDQAFLVSTKLDKVFAKLLKRSDEKLKVLVQQVLDQSAAFSKKKSLEGKISLDASDARKGVAISAIKAKTPPVPGAIAGVKRQRDGGSLSVTSAKRTSSTSASKASGLNTNKIPGTVSKASQIIKLEPKLENTSLAATRPTAKTGIKHVVAKPSSLFSSLQSASKKPGTSNAAQKAVQQVDAKNKIADSKPTPSTTTTATPKPMFSFAETMANLTKPKEETSAAKASDSLPVETEEAKTKRLRKEERRKLRVSFKPDEFLTEIRLFIHDPDEEVGHDDNMIRDAKDVKGEGKMLKMHKDLELGDDDDEGIDGEESLGEWKQPSRKFSLSCRWPFTYQL